MPRIFAAVDVSAIALAAHAEINVVPYPTSVVEKPGSFKCPARRSFKDVVKFSKDASIPKEGYRLSVTPSGIRVAASDKVGAFYALQTLEQLGGPRFVAASDGTKPVPPASIPCVEIRTGQSPSLPRPSRALRSGRDKARPSRVHPVR